MQRMFKQVVSVVEMFADIGMSRFFNAHEPEPAEMEAMVAKRAHDRDRLAVPADTELKTHVQAFGYFNESLGKIKLNAHSMYTAILKSLRLTKTDAATITAASMGLPKFNEVGEVFFDCPVLKGEFSPDVAPKLMHPCDTGFYIKGTGKFNKVLFNKLKHYVFKNADGTLYKKDGMLHISLKQFRQFVNDINEEDDFSHRFGFGPWHDANFIEKTLGCAGNKGEVTALFEVLKRLLEGVWMYGEQYFPLPYIEEWYRDTPKMMRRLEAQFAPGHEPIPPPNYDYPPEFPEETPPAPAAAPSPAPAKADADAVAQEDIFGILSYFKQWSTEYPERFKSVTSQPIDVKCYGTLFNSSACASMRAVGAIGAPAPTPSSPPPPGSVIKL